MIKIQSPVLFDANILIIFKGQLHELFKYFEHILIHEKVCSEILNKSIQMELKTISKKINIQYVKDFNYTDDASKALYKKCDIELRKVFDIENKRDLGEYKTLMYAKFNKICLISSQDTTVVPLSRGKVTFR